MKGDLPAAQPEGAWRGRTDPEPGDARRWHQVIRPFDASSRDSTVLLGFPVDEGVRRNGGRPGAAQGPQALRAALANVPVMGEPALADAGDVPWEGGGLEEAQTRLGERVASVLAQRCFPVVLGGGHEVAWGTFLGIAAGAPRAERVLVVNVDAHFDFRRAPAANSGTPFHQIHDWCAARGRPFVYRVIGVSQFANTRALFDRAAEWGVRYWLDDGLQESAAVERVVVELAHEMRACDAVYLSVDLDALPGEKAPGVSAPAPLGLPLAAVERIVDVAAASGRLVAADLAELNPALDRDGLTARVGARLVARLVRAHARAQRQGAAPADAVSARE
jgi:formiminoglutamase